MLTLLAHILGVVEPDPTATPTPTPTAFTVTPANPPTSQGGVVHLGLAGTPAPSQLTAVFTPTGTVPLPADPSTLVGIAIYPQGSIAVDPTAPVPAAVDITATGVTPGSWDVFVFGTFPDAVPAPVPAPVVSGPTPA